jgi:hypothetical protein
VNPLTVKSGGGLPAEEPRTLGRRMDVLEFDDGHTARIARPRQFASNDCH